MRNGSGINMRHEPDECGRRAASMRNTPRLLPVAAGDKGGKCRRRIKDVFKIGIRKVSCKFVAYLFRVRHPFLSKMQAMGKTG